MATTPEFIFSPKQTRVSLSVLFYYQEGNHWLLKSAIRKYFLVKTNLFGGFSIICSLNCKNWASLMRLHMVDLRESSQWGHHCETEIQAEIEHVETWLPNSSLANFSIVRTWKTFFSELTSLAFILLKTTILICCISDSCISPGCFSNPRIKFPMSSFWNFWWFFWENLAKDRTV